MAMRNAEKYLEEFERRQEKNPQFGVFNALEFYQLMEMAKNDNEMLSILALNFGFMCGYKSGVRATRENARKRARKDR